MKKFYSLIFISIFSFVLFAAEKECGNTKVNILDESNLDNIKKVLLASNLNLKEKQEAFNQLSIDNAHSFLNSLDANEQKKIWELIGNINKAKDPLIQIAEGNGNPILLVDGIDPTEFPHEWVKPFSKLLKNNNLSYFFKWSKYNSIEDNRDQLIDAIKNILEKHKDKKLTIMGYSAGGILTLLAMDKLQDSPQAKRINFNTVASPIFGYNAPAIAWLGAPFVGKTSIEIGLGAYKKLEHSQMSGCNHWVNTNCEMDKHTCENEGVNPQTGGGAITFQLPCGVNHIKRVENEGHASIVNHVFDELVK
jgi:hypothetical protein